jgi:lysophospholipase L1-like esterase
MTGRSPPTHPLANALLALAAVASTLGVVEIGLRVAGYDPLGRFSQGRHRFLRSSANPELGYELVPNARGFAWHREIAINSHGFRDREHALEKPPGTRRIVAIGDSITFAGSMDTGFRFTERLEAQLRAAGRSVEVLNLGVGGYDTLDEVAVLVQKGLAFDPDLVILVFCINDLGVYSANLEMVQVLERYGWLIRRSRLAQLLTVRLDRLQLGSQLDVLNRDDVFRKRYAGRIARFRGDPALDEAIAKLLRLRAGLGRLPPFLGWYTSRPKLGRLRYGFERLQRVADRAGVPVLVVIVPFLDEGNQSRAYSLAYGMVAHEAERLGFEVLNLQGAFRREGLHRLREEDLMHPNADGHALMASELEELLRSRW